MCELLNIVRLVMTTLSLCDSEYHVERVHDVITLRNFVMRVECHVERFHNYSC